MKDIDVLKFKVPALIFSSLFIVAGIIVFILLGFNAGIDFGSGYSESVQIAPLGMTVSYEGSESAVLSVSGTTLTLTFRSASGVEEKEFPSSLYPTAGELGAALAASGLKVKVVDPTLCTDNLVSGFGYPMTLTTSPGRINFSTDGEDVTISSLRSALSEIDGVKVQTVGDKNSGAFQVRVLLKENEGQSEAERRINGELSKVYGEENIVVLQSDFVGPKFSSSLFRSSVSAILIAFVLILLYISVRFRISYALSSIIALIHDVLMMLSFVVILRLEVSSTTIAAVLTIIGYSLNNTIVIFDRVRENIKENRGSDPASMVSWSVRQSFTRTFITTLTTLFAIVPLSIFSTGDIRNFAINLIWGLVVGAYSSSIIAPALLMVFHRKFPIDKIKEKKEEEEYSLVD
ncbi:MAG: protein translocase subunit SecF [Sphaerochaetaceae bacterium]|nr:protein translocase subunit SecF [Sphaerochaetaceae bacterium]